MWQSAPGTVTGVDTPQPGSGADDGSGVAPSALDELGSLDVDGVAAARWGTAAWGVALVVLLLLRDRLAEADATWWIWVAVAGFLGGLAGWWWVARRRDALARAAAGDALPEPPPAQE